MDLVLSSPVYRPLVAYDKQEIIDLGIELGFDEIANRRYKDCCSIIARHPATRANLGLVRAIEEEIGVEDLVEASLAEAVVYEYHPDKHGETTAEAIAVGG